MSDGPGSARRRSVLVAIGVAFALLVMLATLGVFTPPKATQRTVVSVETSAQYGTVLVVGGSATALKGFPLYEFSADTPHRAGCGTSRAVGFDFGSTTGVPLTCTGPMSDMTNDVATDDWPALTSSGPPIAGHGVVAALLGTVARRGIGRQVTYAGHPLYLFDPSSQPFLPQGEDYMETVAPLAPWHGYWYLVAAATGNPVAGRVTVAAETLPDGRRAVGVVVDPNVDPIVVSAYVDSRDRPSASTCLATCAAAWVPVITSGEPRAGQGVGASSLGTVTRPNGTLQVTYDGHPLYLFSREKVFLATGGRLKSPGSAGNGSGAAAAHGARFALVPLAS
ncbi:MAG: hypothetical protein ACRDV0_00880 [Acidimicrobiales bacterium]